MCKLCETKPVYEFTNKRKLCARCFMNYFQKKVLYTIRKFEMIKKGDIIGYRKLRDFRSVVVEDILKMLAEKTNVKIVKLSDKGETDKIANPITVDLESGEIVNELIQGNLKRLKNFKPIEKKIIKPLYLFLDEEVLLYANLKRLQFKQKRKERDKINRFINEAEKKHPEVKRAIVRGFLKIND